MKDLLALLIATLFTLPALAQKVPKNSATYDAKILRVSDGDTIVIAARSNGVQGANADVGTVITFTITLTSAAQATLDGGYNDSINISIPNRIDVVYPESTNLTASWGTVTIG